MDFSWAVIYTVFMANEDKFLTVSQLNALIKNMLEGSFPSIQLKGEISNFKSNSSGHLYFALKDSNSQISGVMFRGRASTLNFKPKDGMLVLGTGSVSVYPPQGRYQIIVTSMVQAGLGAIMEMLEERKKKLAAEGLFDSSRKKVLPFFPGTVGVVTSPTGAAIRDILQIIQIMEIIIINIIILIIKIIKIDLVIIIIIIIILIIIIIIITIMLMLKILILIFLIIAFQVMKVKF